MTVSDRDSVTLFYRLINLLYTAYKSSCESLFQEKFINRFLVSCFISSSTEKLWIPFHRNEHKQWNTCSIKQSCQFFLFIHVNFVDDNFPCIFLCQLLCVIVTFCSWVLSSICSIRLFIYSCTFVSFLVLPYLS